MSEAGPERAAIESVKVLKAAEIGDAEVSRVFQSASVIKARVVRELADVADHVYAANQHARDLVERAEADGVEIRRRAAEQGREEGQREWAKAAAALEAERKRVVAEAEQDLLDLALRLAGKIVGRAVELEPSVAAEIVAETLQHVRGDTRITIEVAPADVAAVQQFQQDLRAIVGGESLVVKANPDVQRGGCVIVSASQRIDARLDTQLAAMRQALEER